MFRLLKGLLYLFAAEQQVSIYQHFYFSYLPNAFQVNDALVYLTILKAVIFV